MKLHWSPRSPFVRKVMIAAHELGLVDRLTCVRTVVATAKPHLELMQENPLSKLPTLVLDDGTVLYDSRVICEYLDTLRGASADARARADAGPRLFPVEQTARLTALRRQALGDGFLDFLLLFRNEGERAHPSDVHLAAYDTKRAAVLRTLEREAGDLARSPFTVGHIAIGCALCYLDFRFAKDDWRTAHRAIAAWHREFAARPSVKATEPIDDS
jgi:glutathione S-transferase